MQVFATCNNHMATSEPHTHVMSNENKFPLKMCAQLNAPVIFDSSTTPRSLLLTGGDAPVSSELLLRTLQRALRTSAIAARVARVAPRAQQLLRRGL
jgi:hypothetical protein